MRYSGKDSTGLRGLDHKRHYSLHRPHALLLHAPQEPRGTCERPGFPEATMLETMGRSHIEIGRDAQRVSVVPVCGCLNLLMVTCQICEFASLQIHTAAPTGRESNPGELPLPALPQIQVNKHNNYYCYFKPLIFECFTPLS